MHDDVGAVLDRPHQIGAGQRVVDDQRQVVSARDVADLLDVDELAARIGEALDEDAARPLVDLALEARGIVRIGPAHLPGEILEGVAELVDRAAIEPARRDEIVTGA